MSAYSDLLLSTGPVAYWRLGETAGSVAVDASGNGHHGTYTNGPALGQPGLIVDADTAVSFDGVDDHVAVTQHADLKLSGAVTVQAWVRPSSFANDPRLLYQGDGGAVILYQLFITAGGAVAFTWSDGAGLQGVVTSDGVIVVGNTYHVVATRSAALLTRIYVNGVQVAEATLTTAPPGDPSFFILGGLPGQFFDGTIDEVAVHNVALTGPQVADLYELGANGPPPPPPPPPSGGGVTRPARRYHRMGRGVTR